MIGVHVHYRGTQPERRRLPAVPVVGSYIIGLGPERRLWQVQAVVHDGPTIDVFCVQVAPRLATELQSTWAAWGDPVELPEGGDGDTPTQRHLEGFAA